MCSFNTHLLLCALPTISWVKAFITIFTHLKCFFSLVFCFFLARPKRAHVNNIGESSFTFLRVYYSNALHSQITASTDFHELWAYIAKSFLRFFFAFYCFGNLDFRCSSKYTYLTISSNAIVWMCQKEHRNYFCARTNVYETLSKQCFFFRPVHIIH